MQQHLVALAVNLQLLRQLVDSDPPAANALVEEIGRDVQQALDETAQLAQRIYPPLLGAGGLAVALREAGASAGIHASVDVAVTGTNCPPEVSAAIYWCCLEALEQAAGGGRATVTVREKEGALAFEVAEDGEHSGAEFDRLRDRVEALGGGLTIRSGPDRDTRVSGWLPLSG